MIVNGIHLPDGDRHFAEEIQKNPLIAGRGTYQIHKLMVAVALCKQFRNAVDAGAHVGLWSRVLARIFTNVHAFEPVAMLREYFLRNIGTTDTFVNLYPCALGNENSEIMMRVAEWQTGSSHVYSEGEPSIVRKLDSFGLTEVDFIKLDIEGMEYWAIKGAKETIQRDRPVIILEQKLNLASRYGKQDMDAVELLKSWGARQIMECTGDYIMGFDNGT